MRRKVVNLKNSPDMHTTPGKRYRLVLAVGFLVGFGGFLSPAAAKFTSLDLEAIGNLAERLSAQFVVFVADRQDFGLLNSVKVLSRKRVYNTVVNTSFLARILEGDGMQLSFFQRRTAMVTREQLELSFLLEKVRVINAQPKLDKVSAPHFLTWIMFRDYTLYPKLYIPVSNQVIFINSTTGGVSAKQMYNLKPEANATIKPFRLTDERLDKINFENVTMNMLILRGRELCRKDESLLNDISTTTKLECVQQEILESVAARLNFSINIVECTEENPFSYPNGSEGELFLKLKHREVDFSSVALVQWVMKKRDDVDLVWPTFVLKSRMYLKEQIPMGRWFTYLKPLESSVWWVILIWILITGVLIEVCERFLKNQLKFNLSFTLDLIMSTLKALQVFCNQALSDIPPSYSIRIIYFLKFFVVVIFYEAYCGYLVSSLTVVVSHLPFTDLKGFFENRQYQIITIQKGFHSFYVRRVIGEDRKEDFMLPEDDLPVTIQEAVDRLCTRDYLTFVEFKEDFLNYDRLSCRISELPTPATQINIGIGFPKKMPLKEFLKREFLHLKSTGIVKRLTSRLSSHSDHHERGSENEFTSVSMTQIFSLFVFLGVGAALSTAILLVELILDRCKYLRNAQKRTNVEKRKYRGRVSHSICTSNATPLTGARKLH